jgi:PAS domain S-box-containing protein
LSSGGSQGSVRYAVYVAAAITAVAAGLQFEFIYLLTQVSTGLPEVLWQTALIGGIFIIASSALTFYLVRRYAGQTKAYQARLLDANATLQVLLEASPIPLMSLDSAGRVRVCNRAAEKVFGWPASEVLGKEHPVISPSGSGRFRELLTMVNEGTPIATEGVQFRRTDGSRIDVSLSMAPVRDSRGSVTGVVAALIDLSDMRRTEEALRESQRVLSTLMSNIPGMAYRCSNDEEWTMEFVSEGCLALTGYSPSVFIGNALKSFNDIIHPEDRAMVWSEVQRALAESQPYHLEYRIVSADGTVKHVWEQGQGVEKRKDKITTLEGLILDVTERHRADAALRESEEKYRLLVENANSIILQMDSDGRIVSFNEFAERFFEYSREEIIGRKASETIVPAVERSGREIGSLVDDIIRDPARYANNVNENMRKDGSRAWVHWTNKVVNDASGRAVGVLAIGTDITELTTAQENLTESENRYRQLVEFSPDAIAIFSDGRFTFVNPSAVALLGATSEDQVLGRDWPEFLDPSSVNDVRESVGKVYSGKEQVTFVEAKLKRLDGAVTEVEAAAIRVSAQGTSAVQIVARDVTQRKEADRERHSFEERLSALHFYDTELNVARSLADVYEITMDAVQRTLGFEHAAFAKVRGDRLVRVSSRGDPPMPDVDLPLDGSGRGIVINAIRSREPVMVPDVSLDPDYVQGIPGTKSELAVPVEMEGDVLGVLDVESDQLNAFDVNDVKLLQILASHMATALKNLEQRTQIEKTSEQLAFLLQSSASILGAGDVHTRLQRIAEAIRELGWRRVVISVRDENMVVTSPQDLVTAGLTEEEREYLWRTTASGESWKNSFDPEFERFKIGSFYYLPWRDPFVRERTATVGISSRLSPDLMVDWHPEDLLYTPLRLADGRMVGVLSVDDPIDGRRPTQASLAPLELFIGQAAVALESARLFEQLEKARNQIKEYAGQLEKKVEERSRELVDAQEKLLKAQRLATIGEVSAQVGHDLRNPLTAINTNLYYLHNVLPRKQKDKVDATLSSMQNAIFHANRIVEDLLEYSRTAALKKTRLVLNSVVTSSLNSVLIPKNVEVSVDLAEGAELDGDGTRLMRVFQNLVSNAVDAMPDGGYLTVASKVADGRATVEVSDTGAGIREENLALLFTPFFTTKSKGLGLGLAICKRLVEAHEGKIDVRSRVGEGTTISVTLPLAGAQKPTEFP